MLYTLTARTEQAETVLLDALERLRVAPGPAHPSTLETLNVLGNICADQGRFEEADGYYREALSGRLKVYGPDHPVTAVQQRNLGLLQMDLGRPDEAVGFYTGALPAYLRALGPQHMETIVLKRMLADAHLARAELDDAEVLYREVLDDIEATVGIGHRQFGFCAESLADVYRATGRADEQRRTVERLLASQRVLAETSSSTADEWNNFAWYLLTADPPELRDPPEALEWARRAAEAADRDPSVLNTLALAQEQTGDVEGAIATLRRGIEMLHEGHAARVNMEGRLAELTSPESP